MPLDPALAELLAAAPDAARAAAVDALRRRVSAPYRTLVVGRTSAGKTSLVQRALGISLPTGLGGVTQAPQEHGEFIDTPGIDDESRAIDVLGPLADRADRIVWVVDGLQPVTASERAVMDAIRPPEVPVVVVVSRRDLLDPAEVPAVLARVRALAGPAEALDLRREAPRLGDHRRSPRWTRLAAALRGLAADLPDPPGVEDLVARWRAEVRALLARLERQAAEHPDPIELRAALATGGRALVAAFGEHGVALPAPRLDRGPHPLFAGLAGAGGAVRELRATAARWLADGEIAIREEWPAAVHREAERAQVARFGAALQAALAALDTWTDPTMIAASSEGG